MSQIDIDKNKPIKSEYIQKQVPHDSSRETTASAPPKVACYRHTESSATDTCPRCLKPICDVCAMPSASGFFCPECNRSRAQRGLFFKVTGFFLISGLLLGGGIFFFKLRPTPL